jgi:FkbM family methyltransferase
MRVTEPAPPFGVSLAADLVRYLAAAPVRTVVDVGAHEGESLEEFVALFPDAQVFSFEPLPASFRRAAERARHHDRAHAFQLALCEAPGTRIFRSGRHACLSSLLAADVGYAWPSSPLDIEQPVECDTLDRVAARLGIAGIDLLKIDVQGAEHLVLEGARTLLAGERIQAVRMEVLFLALYEGQAPFGALLETMRVHGFDFCGLYDCFHDARGWLCWGDALFVHRRVRQDLPRPTLP